MRLFSASPIHFEQWDWRQCESGIGGSEQHAAEMAWRLQRRGHDVTVYAPIPNDCPGEWRGTKWKTLEEADFSQPGVWLLYRAPELLDAFTGSKDQRLILIAQDEGYRDRLTPERAEKLEKYLVLSPAHMEYTKQVHPFLGDKLTMTSNGIKCDLIQELEREGIPERNPKKIMYASSPDRGLPALIEIFTRAREWVPDLELHVFYGFNNIEKLIQYDKKFAGYKEYRERVLKMMERPGITHHGRVSQRELYHEWMTAGMWVYPSEFGETSPCHGDSIIETVEHGREAIRNLVGKEFHVYSCDAEGQLSISRAKDVRCTRQNHPVITLRFRPGRGRNAKKETTLTLTRDHEVMLVDGTYRPAGELKLGDRVKAFSRHNSGWGRGYATIGLTGHKAVPEHRFVAEYVAGRALRPNEVVDHLDGNTRNESFENLIIRESHSDHVRSHWIRMTPEEKEKALIARSEGLKKARMSETWRANSAERAYIMGKANAGKTLSDETRRNIRESGQRSADARFGHLPWHDKERLYDLYINQGLSTVEIGELLGCSDFAVSRYLKRFGIPIRTMRDAQLVKRAQANHVVVGIDDAGSADVFCMEVEPDHNFIANGIVIHNCITCMEAQALGAIPIFHPYWALKDNVMHGIAIEGWPYRDLLTQARYVGEIVSLINQPDLQKKIREPMMREARMRFDWERWVTQFCDWIDDTPEKLYGHAEHSNGGVNADL